MTKCKHEWRKKYDDCYVEQWDFYYCIHCLAGVKQNTNTLSYNISLAEKEDEVE
jgi:hypothetical protein